MEIIKVEFKKEIKEKLFEILASFSSEELKITYEDSDFEKNKRKLETAAAKLHNGTEKLYTFEELDEILEKTISKYED